MGIFKKITSLFSPSRSLAEYAYRFKVRCKRCGEEIQGRVDLRNDLSPDYDSPESGQFFCRKIIMGSGHCFQKIEVVLRFNERREVIDRHITGGEFIDLTS